MNFLESSLLYGSFLSKSEFSAVPRVETDRLSAPKEEYFEMNLALRASYLDGEIAFATSSSRLCVAES